jgi:hypothetical protein
MKGESKAKAKGKKAPAVEYTAAVAGPDGVTYTVKGCSAEEVRAALDDLRGQLAPRAAGTPPPASPTPPRPEGE